MKEHGMSDSTATATLRVKTGLAEMLKGGVIMDDVHDHAALEHLGEAGLDAQGRGGGAVAHSVLLHLAACGCSYFPLARVRFGWFSLPPARSANNPSRKCGKAARAPRGRRVRCCPDYFITMFWLFSMTWNQVTPGESLMVWPLAARNVGGPVRPASHVPS